MNKNTEYFINTNDTLNLEENKFDKFMVIGTTSLASMLPTMLALPYAEGKIINLLMVQAAIALFGIGYSLIKEQNLSENLNQNNESGKQIKAKLSRR